MKAKIKTLFAMAVVISMLFASCKSSEDSSSTPQPKPKLELSGEGLTLVSEGVYAYNFCSDWIPAWRAPWNRNDRSGFSGRAGCTVFFAEEPQINQNMFSGSVKENLPMRLEMQWQVFFLKLFTSISFQKQKCIFYSVQMRTFIIM